MKLLFIIAFVTVYAFFGVELGYTSLSPWHRHFTYMFQHANFMHLFLNSVSFWILFRGLQRLYPRRRIIVVSMLSAFAMSFFCYYDKPVVGASGMVYAMAGMYLHVILSQSCKSRFREPMALYVFVASVTIMIGISFSKENSAALLHLLCLIAGFSSTWGISLRSKYVQQHIKKLSS